MVFCAIKAVTAVTHRMRMSQTGSGLSAMTGIRSGTRSMNHAPCSLGTGGLPMCMLPIASERAYLDVVE